MAADGASDSSGSGGSYDEQSAIFVHAARRDALGDRIVARLAAQDGGDGGVDVGRRIWPFLLNNPHGFAIFVGERERAAHGIAHVLGQQAVPVVMDFAAAMAWA